MKEKDIYKFWSRKKLKLEIENLKSVYNQLFDQAKNLNNDVADLLRERNQIQRKLSDERIKNRKLKKENEKLLKEHQKIYDCIQKWYEPIDNTKMAKFVEETKKIFESFLNVKESE